MEAWYGTIEPAVSRKGAYALSRFDELPNDALVMSIVAETYLGCGKTKLHHMRKRGELEVVRTGPRSVRYVVGSLRNARKALSAAFAAPIPMPSAKRAAQRVEEVCA